MVLGAAASDTALAWFHDDLIGAGEEPVADVAIPVVEEVMMDARAR